MKAAGRLAFWLVPPLLCLALYWSALKTWFQGDDFAWLALSLQVHDWRSFLSAMFAPMAQGTIRPLSERGFFLLFYQLFGLEAVPYRIWVFLTEFGCLALVASITRRITGSRRPVCSPPSSGSPAPPPDRCLAGLPSTTRRCAPSSFCWPSTFCCATSRPANGATGGGSGRRFYWASARWS